MPVASQLANAPWVGWLATRALAKAQDKVPGELTPAWRSARLMHHPTHAGMQPVCFHGPAASTRRPGLAVQV